MFRNLAISSCALIVLASCDKGVGPVHTKVEAVKVSPDSIEIAVGDTVRFTATLAYNGAPPAIAPILKWDASPAGYLTIDSTGTAVAVTSLDKVTVAALAGGVMGSASVRIVRTATMRIDPTPGLLYVGVSRVLTACIESENPYAGCVATTPSSWTTSSPAVASVDGAGVVTALTPGIVTITAMLAGKPVRSEFQVLAWPSFRFSAISGAPNWDIDGIPEHHRDCGLNASDGGIYCWGRIGPAAARYERCVRTYTQAHREELKCSLLPIRLSAPTTFAALSSGNDGGCGLSPTGEAYCFGANGGGELGFGPPEYQAAHRPWIDHEVTKVLTAERFQSIYAGGQQRCGIRSDGVAFCWGWDIGSTPVEIPGRWLTMASRSSLVRNVGKTDAHLNCGLRTDSTAYCWRGDPATAAQVTQSRWKGIDITSYWVSCVGGCPPALFVCGLDAAGAVSCWSHSGLAVTQAPTRATGGPTLVFLGPMATQNYSLSSAYGPFSQTCGLDGVGDVYCVAATGAAPSYAYSLVKVDLGVRLKQFAGECGIGMDDKAYCWLHSDMKAKLVVGQ